MIQEGCLLVEDQNGVKCERAIHLVLLHPITLPICDIWKICRIGFLVMHMEERRDVSTLWERNRYLPVPLQIVLF